jgi:hypothetical protein
MGSKNFRLGQPSRKANFSNLGNAQMPIARCRGRIPATPPCNKGPTCFSPHDKPSIASKGNHLSPSHNTCSQFWFQWKIQSKWSDLIGWGQLQFFHFMCNKNLFFCNFLGHSSSAPPTYDMIKDEIKAESTLSAHFSNLTPSWTSLSSSDKWHSLHHVLSTDAKNINWHHWWSDFLKEKSLEWESIVAKMLRSDCHLLCTLLTVTFQTIPWKWIISNPRAYVT